MAKAIRGKMLTIIGVHTPETEAEKKVENVRRQVKKLGITYPVLLDQASVNWRKWQQQVWPAIYLVDNEGMCVIAGWENSSGKTPVAKKKW